MSRPPKPAPTPAIPEAIDDPSARDADLRKGVAAPPPGRLALRLDELAASLGISRRTLERERSAGRFPPPDLHIGKCPLWRPETVRRWIDGGGR